MHTPNLSLRLQLQRYLLSCKVRCRRATHFLESRTCRLAQAVYGKCSLVLPSRCNLSIVVSDPRSHHRRCGLDPTAVSPAPPFSQVFAFDRSRERRGRAMAPRTQRCPRSGEAVPGGFSAADAWKMVSRYTWGSRDRATRGHFCLSLPFASAFADRRQPSNPSIGPVLFHQRVELLPREVFSS